MAARSAAGSGKTDLRRDLIFRRLFEADIIGILFADTEGWITRANDLLLHMLGYERDELPLRWDELTPPEWEPMDEVKRCELAETGIARPWEKEYWHRDGHRVPILVGVALLEGSEKDAVGFVLDRTDQVQTEVELRASIDRFRELYDSIPLMYFMLDDEGVVESVNARGARKLGYMPAELEGRPVLDVFHPEDRAAGERHLGSVLEGRGEVEPVEFRKVRKDGSTLWVEETIRTLDGHDGKKRLQVICEDVTKKRETARHLTQQERQLEQLVASIALAEERERRRIGKGIHDEIGQNLAVAKLKLDDLERLEPTAEAGEALARIRELLDRTVHACRGLTLELASPVLYELGLEAALEDLGYRVEKHHGIRCEIESDGSLGDSVSDLAGVLFRISRELVHNVVKHARAGSLRIRLDTTDRQVRIAFEDDGVGFDAAEGDGLGGFGLLSARERLRRIGGRLRVDSAPGAGTRVEIVVPRTVEDRRPGPASEDPGP